MKPFQPVKFQSLEDFLSYLPDEERRMVDRLRHLVLDCLPDAQERLAYNVPFYYRHRRICYIWPSAVPWGKVREGGVQLGFPEGYRMQDEIGWLERGSRKQVYMKTFMSLAEIDEDMVRAYLFEAAEVDEKPPIKAKKT